MKQILLISFLLMWITGSSQDSTFANSNLTFTGHRVHNVNEKNLQLTNINELRFDIFHQDIQQHVLRGFTSGTQHAWFMRVTDGPEKATFQLIVDTQHNDSQIELAGTGNTPIHFDSDAYVRFGNQSALKEAETRYYDAGNSNYIGFKSPQNVLQDMVYTWPVNKPTGPAILSSDVDGVLEWVDPAQSGGQSTIPGTSISMLNVMCSWPSWVVSGGTQYFGSIPKPLTPLSGSSKIYFRTECVITATEVSATSMQAGTGEPWSMYIRVNNTTDYLVATVNQSTQFRVFSNPDMNVQIQADDYVEMKMVNPQWAVVPINCTFGGYLTIQQ